MLQTQTVKLHKLELSLSIPGDDGKVLAEFINPRTHSALSPDEINELAANIKDRGLEVPLSVRRVTVPPGPGREGYEGEHWVVIDGQRRLLALKTLFTEDKLASDDIPVVVKDGDVGAVEFTPSAAAVLLKDSLAISTQRGGLSSYELAQAGLRLKAADTKPPEIAAAIGRSPTWVSRILGACKSASPEVLDAWRQGKLTDEKFKDLAAAAKSKQAEVLHEVLELEATGDKSAARAIAKVNAPAPRATKAAEKAARGEAKVTALGKKYEASLDGSGASGGKSGGANLGMGGGKTPGGSGVAAKEWKPEKEKPLRIKPSPARIQEFVELRKNEPSSDQYVRGLLDGIAFAAGEISEDTFAKAYKTWFAAVAKRGIKTSAAKGVVTTPKGKAPKAKKPRRFKPNGAVARRRAAKKAAKK